MIGLLQKAAQGLGNLTAFSETMADVGMQLAAMATAGLPDQPSDELAAVLAGLRGICTMGAERSVHDGLFGTLVPAAVASQASAEMSSGFMLF